MIFNVLERHRDKWVEDGECYRWIGAASRGQPVIGVGGKKIARVSRLMCEEAHGPPPFDKPLALHDTPNGCIGGLCVNGEHLRWGDKRENIFDEPIERRQEWAKRARETKGPEGRTRMRKARWAAMQAGEDIYFSEKPCKRGHTGPRSINGHCCLECRSIANAARYRGKE